MYNLCTAYKKSITTIKKFLRKRKEMKKTLFLPQTKAAEEFVCDGSGFFRSFFRAKGTGTVAADKSHAVSGLRLRNMADVDDKLVHTDISDHMRLFPLCPLLP